MNCPNCKTEILTKNANIQADIAKCESCGNIFKISDYLFDDNTKFDINQAPNGAWYVQGFEKTILGASTRSPFAFFIVPFMIVWSGGALGGIYGTQIFSGNFNPMLSLFGIPFVIGSIIFWSIALMTIWGKIELTFDKKSGKIFTGVGKIGFTKNFQWSEIAKIEEITSISRRKLTTEIAFEGKTRTSFGSGLNDERRFYLLSALRKIHSQMKWK